MEKTNKRANLYFVDLLTVIAAIFVLIVHVTHVLAGFHVIDYKTFPTAWFYRFDVSAVQLFFILSGFKISLSISNKISNKTFSYYKYILKRIFSIWFIYMLALIAYFIFRFYFRQSEFESLNAWDYLSHILLLNAFNPISYNTTVASGWFIGCIMIYYALTPFLLKVFNNTNKSLILCIIAFVIRFLFSFLVNKPLFGYEDNIWSTFHSQSFPMHFCFYTLGILAYNIVIKKDISFNKFVVIPSIIMCVLLWYNKDQLVYDSIILFFLFLICSFIKVDSNKHKIIPTLSKFTLPVYLFQMLLLRSIAMFVNFKELSDWSIWWITLISSTIILFALGAVLYYLINRPIDKLYNTLFNK